MRVFARWLEPFIKSTTLTMRTFSLREVLAQDVDRGESLERRHVAAAAMTTSGSPPGSLLAESERPMPACSA